jgi:hypothetical protein
MSVTTTPPFPLLKGLKIAAVPSLALFPVIVLSSLLVWSSDAAQPSLTIYNQNFAVVRDTVSLELKTGLNQVRFTGATAYLEPSSVVLRDPGAYHQFTVIEQNFRGDPVSQEALLELNEGKTIEFETVSQENGRTKRELLAGKIVRSGYTHGLQPLIEVNGKLRFGLPGQPIFPALAENTILKPTLTWTIQSEQAARFDAELSYITSGMLWEADYNLLLPEKGDDLDLVGWITIDNNSGKSFQDAQIKLMAGDVNRIQSWGIQRASGGSGGSGPPPVAEKSFDDYHLYTLERPTTLLDREKKQVEFVRGERVKSTPLYVYDGASTDEGQNWVFQGMHSEPEYGLQVNRSVWVFREFTNSTANHLGLPLPKGRIRLYRRNNDGQMEFTGENTIKHTPRDEVIHLYTGNAFDLVGERKRTAFKAHLPPIGAVDPATGLPIPPGTPTATNSSPWIDETFEITLRNHKREAVETRVVEHLYRWTNWQIEKKSDEYRKVDAQTIEFRVGLAPDQERTISYTAHYSLRDE